MYCKVGQFLLKVGQLRCISPQSGQILSQNRAGITKRFLLQIGAVITK